MARSVDGPAPRQNAIHPPELKIDFIAYLSVTLSCCAADDNPACITVFTVSNG